MVKKTYSFAIIISFAGLLFTSHLLAEPFPVHPKIVKIEEKNILLNGIDVKMYRYESALSASETFTFYHDNLIARGWNADFESQDQDPYLMSFSSPKPERINLNIYFRDGEPGCGVVVTQYLGDMQPPSQDKDVPGRDLPWFSRYSGGVRYMDMEWERGKNIVYVNKQADFDLIVDFYRGQLISSGWELKRDKVLTPQNTLDKSPFLPDNMKKEAQIPGEEVNPQAEKQASLLFLKGHQLLLLAVTQTKGDVATTVNYIADYQKEMQ
jgi:hypothetical protein